jgi:2-keto-4-pentenoate hydratase/2-oxohepta-3-ene-1,7-dioic acid hydratase in catechol pathway
MKWLLSLVALSVSLPATSAVEHYVRYLYQGNTYYGKLDDAMVRPITGDLFGDHQVSNTPLSLDDVELLIPTQPEKVFAVGMNFASHLSSPSQQPPPLFLKLPSSLIASGKDIHVAKDARNLHFEGELVLVIGKTTRNVTLADAKASIFGVTVGNDLTERSWQSQDLQWMRAKAADGFGPIATTITRGFNYEDALLTTRLNGKVVQQESTRYMIHSSSKVVSYLSQYFTLKPGDLIFMGTPGKTQALSDGDVVSVTIDGVGTVENTIQFD